MELKLVFSIVFLFCISGPPLRYDKLPYGMTFFGHPTGRMSDGRVIIDFIAEEFELPLLPASMANSSGVSHGVNFAVGGALATGIDYFERNNIVAFKLLNTSLDVQLGWFEQLKPSICNTTAEQANGFKNCFGKSLFFVGEFGMNDYDFLWTAGKTKQEVESYVPQVVRKITMGVERLINQGAIYVVVVGNPPNGCAPALLTVLMSPNRTDYDGFGCLRALNGVAKRHNTLLRVALGRLRGFASDGLLRACCGTGGTYNYNVSSACALPGVIACKDPSASISWDGIHYTEAINRYVAKGWLYGPYADPPILTAIHH